MRSTALPVTLSAESPAVCVPFRMNSTTPGKSLNLLLLNWKGERLELDNISRILYPPHFLPTRMHREAEPGLQCCRLLFEWIKKNVITVSGYSACHSKVQQTGLKQQRFIFSQFWILKVQDQGVSRVNSFLLGSWVSSYRLPPVCICVQISSSYKDTGHSGVRSTLMTSFLFNYLFIDSSPNTVTFGRTIAY